MQSHTVDAPNATLHYDIRPGDTPPGNNRQRPLMLIGSPMAAAGFTTLAGHFTDRTVITYDPRGSERSTHTGDTPPTATEHASDIRRVIETVGEPVDLFASSGGAVNALALLAEHPSPVHTLVAHEPPTLEVLPDRAQAEAATRAIAETYAREGFGAAMARFIALVGWEGPVPDDYADQPTPGPAAFGLPTADDGSRDDPLLGNMTGATFFEHDYDALRATDTTIVMAVGETSRDQLPARGAAGVADRLGLDVVVFPGDHSGFLGGEYGQTGKPAAFAARLREVLASNA